MTERDYSRLPDPVDLDAVVMSVDPDAPPSPQGDPNGEQFPALRHD